MATLLRIFAILSLFASTFAGEILTLNEENWRQMLKGEWMVEL